MAQEPPSPRPTLELEKGEGGGPRTPPLQTPPPSPTVPRRMVQPPIAAAAEAAVAPPHGPRGPQGNQGPPGIRGSMWPGAQQRGGLS